MSVQLGVNCGFIEVSPITDPNGAAVGTIDNSIRANKFTSPIDIYQINEMGWYCSNASEAANYEVGVYADNAGAVGDLLYSVIVNAKGTTEGWKKVIDLAWDIVGNTAYWLAVQCDDTNTATTIDRDATANTYRYLQPATALPANGGTMSESVNYYHAIYAVYSVATLYSGSGLLSFSAILGG